MTTGRLGLGAPPGRQAPGRAAPPNAAYAGQVVHFPDPVRAARHPRGVRVDEHGYPDFSPYARAAAEIAEPPEGFGVDELRLTDYVSANAALSAAGHELWDTVPSVATPHGWTWHHVAGTRRLELIPVEVKALLRHHGGIATAAVDHAKRGTRPLQETRPAHFGLPKNGVAVTESQVQGVEEDLGYRLPGPYRSFLKAAGGCAPVGTALDPELGLLIDQPFLTVRDEAAVNDLVYVNKCLRDHSPSRSGASGPVRCGSAPMTTPATPTRRSARPSGSNGCCCRAARTSTPSCPGWWAPRPSWRRWRI
jgi:hypothetical protein